MLLVSAWSVHEGLSLNSVASTTPSKGGALGSLAEFTAAHHLAWSADTL